jgi:uncharacterized protein with beta-barrel porin domain
MTDVWACPSGIAAAGRPLGLRFRDAFLGTVAAGALSLAFSGPALALLPAGCSIDATSTIETCVGNQSNGIAIINPVTLTTLNVNNLSQAIAPPVSGGIIFTSAGAITITSNTGAFGITTAGDNANGIYAGSGIAATVTSTGNITTGGANADGIFAAATSGTVTVTSAGNISTGGTGAGGIVAYSASAVTVTSIGNITTGGVTADGIQATGGGIDGTVTVTSTGNITTGGYNARGINAIGAGAVTVTSTGNITTGGATAYGIKATGFGAVTVTSTGNITTAGNSIGISANSTGAGAVTVTSTGNITTSNAVGINAYSSGAVTVTSTGNVTTGSTGAIGIFALGVGAGAVTVTSTGNIGTTGSSAAGIYARGNGAEAETVTSTGNITTAGDGAFGIRATGFAAVTVTSTGNIATTGASANGIYAVSLVGGAVTVTSTGNITTAGDGAFGIEASANAGAVTVTSAGNITAAGNSAFGIQAVSDGAGAVTVTSTGNITTGGYNARGISAIGGGAVAVTSAGNITAAGNSSNGIYASGFGSGGVAVTSTGNITVGGDSSNGIIALNSGTGAIVVTSTGNIKTTGNYADGIFAAGAGAVTVTSTGNITTAGSGSFGISAEGGGPFAVTIKSGTVSGGSGSGAGVDLAGGTNNTLTNFGTVMALSGLAILGDTGNNTVNNSGTVIGNVLLGSGTNAFNNLAGGFFDSGATVDLGAGNTLTNAGTLSPGGAGVIQTTALTGNLVQSATGRLVTDINIAGATSDRVNVSGTANLAGAVQVQVLNPTLGAFQQTILSAAGGTTTNGLSLLASPVLHAQLVFPNATDVVVKSAGINFLTPGLNNNQTSLANAFNGAAQTAGLGGPVFNFLLNGVTSVPGYNLALNQLSGEAATGTQQATFDAMNTFMGAMLDPFNRGATSAPGGSVSGYASEGDASAYAADGRKRTAAERDAYAMFTKAPPQTFEARWNVWAAGFGGSQTTDGNAAVGSNGATSRIAGTAVGADYLFSPDTIAGFALAGGGTNYVVGNGLGSGRSDLFQAGVYARHTMGAAYIAGALAYGWQDITTDRTVTLAGLDQLQARFNANAFSGRVEGGYRFVSPWIGGIGITPYAAAQFTTFDLPAYAEQALIGTNNFALAYGAKSVTDPRSELGFRTDKSFAMPDGVLTLRGRLAWAHDYDTDRSIAATFQTLPGASFVVNGAAQASDSALTTATIEMKWRNNWSVAATFEGEFSNVTNSYAGKGVVRYQW